MWLPVVPHEYKAFSHNLEVGPFPSYFVFPSVPGPFWRADKKLGSSREVVDLFKDNIANFTCVIFQVQDCVTYPLGIDEPPDAIGFYISPL